MYRPAPHVIVDHSTSLRTSPIPLTSNSAQVKRPLVTVVVS